MIGGAIPGGQLVRAAIGVENDTIHLTFLLSGCRLIAA